jgi:hypothetical protein
VDVALIADGLAKRFKSAKTALAACLLFWVDTQCTDPALYTDVFDRLDRDEIRPSKGADFNLSLACLSEGRVDRTFEITPYVVTTLNALCRAVWQRTRVGIDRRPEYSDRCHPESVVYPRVFWEAWGAPCPDFSPAIVQCIQWMNFAYTYLVNGNVHLQPTTTLPPRDMLFYGLVSHVSGHGS